MSRIYIPEVIAESYCLPLNDGDLQKIEDRDESTDYCETLCLILQRDTRADNVDYSGHYGENLFFSLSTVGRKKEDMEKILNIVQNYINNL